YGLEFARQVLARIGFADRWAYHDTFEERWFGPCADTIQDICRTSDVVLNLCNVNPLREWLLQIPARVYVDEDPSFTQIRHLRSPELARQSSQHTAFFSFGANFGSPKCDLPDDGFAWQPTRQPLVVHAIPSTTGPVEGKFTTVMLWESYPSLEFGGLKYGMKSVSFQDYIDMPRRVLARVGLAIGGGDITYGRVPRRGG